MAKRIKEIVEIREHRTLDQLIEQLVALRDSLPADAEPELRMRGDDVFGRQLAISYFRHQTDEETEIEARYEAAYRETRARELSKLQEELGAVCHFPARRAA